MHNGCLWYTVAEKNPSDPVYQTYIINASVKQTAGCRSVSFLIKARRSSVSLVMCRLQAGSPWSYWCIAWPTGNWRRPQGHPCTTWLRRIVVDVQTVNISIHSAWRKATVIWSGNVPSTWHFGNIGTEACHWKRRRIFNKFIIIIIIDIFKVV